MSIDRIVMAFAGVVILASLGLSQVHHVNWLWLSAFVGANLLARPSRRPSLSRLLGGIRMLSFVERHHPSEPHWYVGVLGVAPAAQGRGVGRALLDDVFARSAADDRPVYLETTNPDNVALYEHFGFEIRERLEPPGGGPPVWTMLRGPVA